MVGLPLNHDLVVLAGGRATRMGGRPKPLLRDAQGRSLIHRICRALPRGDVLVVAPPSRQLGLHDELNALAAEGRSVQLVADPGEGPAWATLAAARVSGASRLWVIAGDHVTASDALADRLESAAEGHEGAWVVDDGRPQPLFCLLDRERLLEVAGATPPRSAMRLFARLSLAEIDGADLSDEERRGLEDVDTPEDAARHQLS